MVKDTLHNINTAFYFKVQKDLMYSLVPKESNVPPFRSLGLTLRPSVHPLLLLGSICNFGEKIGDDLFYCVDLYSHDSL